MGVNDFCYEKQKCNGHFFKFSFNPPDLLPFSCLLYAKWQKRPRWTTAHAQTRTDVNILQLEFFMTPMDDCTCADAYTCEFFHLQFCFALSHTTKWLSVIIFHTHWPYPKKSLKSFIIQVFKFVLHYFCVLGFKTNKERVLCIQDKIISTNWCLLSLWLDEYRLATVA